MFPTSPAPADPKKIATMDETAVELGKSNRSRRGWGKIGEAIIARRYYTQKGQLIMIPLMVDCEGTVVHADCDTGSYTADKCAAFFESCREKLEQSDIEFIQLDGSPTHNATVRDKINSIRNRHGVQIQVVKQPPYSPHFNPCELVNGWLKSQMKLDPNPGINLETFREQLFRTLSRLTPQTLRGFYRFCHFVNVD